MQKIRKILEMEISEGSIKWEVLQQKIEAALKLTDNNFEVIREDTVEKTNLKLEDALTFAVKRKGTLWCYKLIQPRFLATSRSATGGLYASGIQKGTYGFDGQPVFPFPAVAF
jgi:hypothetical protein